MLVLTTLQFTVFLCLCSCAMVSVDQRTISILVDSLPQVGRNGTVLHVGYRLCLDEPLRDFYLFEIGEISVVVVLCSA